VNAASPKRPPTEETFRPPVRDVWFMSRALNRRLMLFGVGLNLAGLVALALIVGLNHNRDASVRASVNPEAPDTVAEASAPLPAKATPKTPIPSAEKPPPPENPPQKLPEKPSEKPAPTNSPAPPVAVKPVQPPTVAPVTLPPATAVKTDTGGTARAQTATAQTAAAQTAAAQTATARTVTGRSGPVVAAKPKAPTTSARPTSPAPSVRPKPAQPNAALASPVPGAIPAPPSKTKSDSTHSQDDQGATATGLNPQNPVAVDAWSQTCALLVDARTLEPRMKPSPSPTILGPNGEPVWPPAELQRDAARLESDGIALFASDPDEALALLGPSRQAVTVEAIISAADSSGASDTDSVFVSSEDANTIRSLDPRCRVVFVR
jgi:hypothetical protein